MGVWSRITSGTKRLTALLKDAEPFVTLIASVAVIVGTVFVWREVRSIEQASRIDAQARDRPALIFGPDVTARVTDIDGSSHLLMTIKIANHGSGTAYGLDWRVADQMPPLHSDLESKDAVFASAETVDRGFTQSLAPVSRNAAVGPTAEQTVTVNHTVTGDLNRGEYHVTKYIAVLFESETKRRNAAVLDLEAVVRRGKVEVLVRELALVSDPRDAPPRDDGGGDDRPTAAAILASLWPW